MNFRFLLEVASPSFSRYFLVSMYLQESFQCMQLFSNVDSCRSFGWVRWISYLFYSYRAALVNEFEGVTFSCKPTELCQLRTGEDVLHSFYMTGVDKGINTLISFIWLLLFGALACVFLMLLHKERR